MRHLFLLTLLTHFSLFTINFSLLPAQPTRTYPTTAQRKAFYDQLAAKYNSPAIREILASDKKNAFDQYVDGTKEEDLIHDYGTVIHELLHGYDGHEIDDHFNQSHHYYIAPAVKIQVPMGKYYNSTELNTIVRKGTQDSIFRYGLYIGGKSDLHGTAVDLNRDADSEVMSVKMGIYGIVEEYNAYYHDNQSIYELYEYYRKTYGDTDSEALTRYMNDVEKATVACYEFRLFVGWYLLHAKRKHPEIHQDILKNKALRTTFTLIDDRYLSLIQQIAARRKALTGKLEVDAFSLLDFTGSDDDFYRFITLTTEDAPEDPRKLDPAILKEYRKLYKEFAQQVEEMDPTGKMRIFANTTQQIAYLTRLMTPELENALAAFRMEGVTLENWKQFINN
jgi:hypothetical protein